MFSPDMYSKRSVKTIENHDSLNPLFLMVSYQSPHNPIMKAPDEYRDQYKGVEIVGGIDRAATITAIDKGVGDIIEALKQQNLYENSFILFSSDNGGSGNHFNIPLRGRKEQVSQQYPYTKRDRICRRIFQYFCSGEAKPGRILPL